MAQLVWKHGKTQDEARHLVQAKMNEAGIADKVIWTGNQFQSNVGWGAVLSLVGEITDHEILLSKVSGMLSGTVLAKSRDVFEQMFPGGDISNQPDAQLTASAR